MTNRTELSVNQTVIVINSVQAEKIKIANPTFLDPFDLRVHMPGHFPPWDVVFSYHPGPLGPGPNPPRPDPPILTVLGC